MATVSELLPGAAVRLEAPAADWREAVRLAGDLLTETGAGTREYTAEMIHNVEENGPYIVIAPGFALAHARPSPAVLQNGMSWVRLAQPVEFGHESNDPVDLVVGLAAKDQAAHQAALAALAQLLADPATERELKDAGSPEALLALLGGGQGSGPQDRTGGDDAPGTSARRERPDDGPGDGPDDGPRQRQAGAAEDDATAEAGAAADAGASAGEGASVHKILTVCGNGLGTSLFLKTTLEQVLQRWGWSSHVTVEATDTVSAKGKASEAVAVFTSREIAAALADVSVPVRVVEDFTSAAEVDGALRDTYDV